MNAVEYEIFASPNIIATEKILIRIVKLKRAHHKALFQRVVAVNFFAAAN
jgi:hypothetical protein